MNLFGGFDYFEKKKKSFHNRYNLKNSCFLYFFLYFLYKKIMFLSFLSILDVFFYFIIAEFRLNIHEAPKSRKITHTKFIKAKTQHELIAEFSPHFFATNRRHHKLLQIETSHWTQPLNHLLFIAYKIFVLIFTIFNHKKKR